MIFIFFNFIGVLNLKFTNQIFKITKLRLKFLQIYILFSMIIRLYKLIEFIVLTPNDENLSKFSFNYFNLLVLFNIFSTSFWTLILSSQQKNIANIFKIFIKLKKVCEIYNFTICNDQCIRKIRNSLLLFNIICISFLITFISSFKRDKSFRNFIRLLYNFLIELPNVIYPYQCLNFVNLMLNHYEILLETFNCILENKCNLVHNDCEFLLHNILKIHKLFDLMNKSFGIVFSVSTFKQLVNVSAVVRCLKIT